MSFFGRFQSFLLMVVQHFSCDFGVFMTGHELKSFYSAVLSGIEGLLLVWMLLSPSSACIGSYILHVGCASTLAT